MSSGFSQNITYIDDLPDIEEIEGPAPFQTATRDYINQSQYPASGMIPQDEAIRVNKYIRGKQNPPMSESGMGMEGPEMYYPEDEVESVQSPPMLHRHSGPTCLEVADHIAMCPICSKFYNNDRSVYIISIVVLIVIVIMLLKKILDV